jgi:hypothetical protein
VGANLRIQEVDDDDDERKGDEEDATDKTDV